MAARWTPILILYRQEKRVDVSTAAGECGVSVTIWRGTLSEEGQPAPIRCLTSSSYLFFASLSASRRLPAVFFVWPRPAHCRYGPGGSWPRHGGADAGRPGGGCRAAVKGGEGAAGEPYVVVVVVVVDSPVDSPAVVVAFFSCGGKRLKRSLRLHPTIHTLSHFAETLTLAVK